MFRFSMTTIALMLILAILLYADNHSISGFTPSATPSLTDNLAPITAENALQLVELARYAIDYKIWSLDWSPDGSLLAIGAAKDGEQIGGIWLLDIEQNELRHFADVATSTLAFHPDGQTLVSARADTLIFWNVATGQRERTIVQPEYSTCPFDDTHFSADGHYVASGNASCLSVEIMDVSTGDLIYFLNGIEELVFHHKDNQGYRRANFVRACVTSKHQSILAC